MSRLFALVAISLIASSVVADSWLPPTPETYTSRNGNFRLTVFPRGLADTLPLEEQECEATLEKLVGDHYQELWRRPLINKVAPVSALVSDISGSFVTFDNWHSMGWGDSVIVIYDSEGELKKKLPLTAIMSNTEFEALPRSVSSIWWSGKHEIGQDENVALVRVVTGIESDNPKEKYKTVRIHLGTAEILP